MLPLRGSNEASTCKSGKCRDLGAVRSNQEIPTKPEIIHEEKEENFWSIKAYKGGTGNMIIGNIREAEVMISGSKGHYDLILSTGAWGKNIIIPGAIASIATLGVGAAVGGISALRAHTFEKNFWEYVNSMIANIGKGKATISEPETVTEQ